MIVGDCVRAFPFTFNLSMYIHKQHDDSPSLSVPGTRSRLYMKCVLLTESVKLTDEQKQSLLGSIDYSRLSEAALLRAYETELVPQSYVTRAALELCAKLRQELDEAKHIIISQERELEKMNTARFTSHYSKPRPETRGK